MRGRPTHLRLCRRRQQPVAVGASPCAVAAHADLPRRPSAPRNSRFSGLRPTEEGRPRPDKVPSGLCPRIERIAQRLERRSLNHGVTAAVHDECAALAAPEVCDHSDDVAVSQDG